MDKEQEFKKTVYEMNFFEQQARELQARANALQMLYNENESALKALEFIEKGQENFFPLGSGVLVNARVSGETVLVDVGSRVVVEKNVGEAKEILSSKKKELERALNEVQTAFTEVAKKLSDLNAKANELKKELVG